jgi:hypothetical protein
LVFSLEPHYVTVKTFQVDTSLPFDGYTFVSTYNFPNYKFLTYNFPNYKFLTYNFPKDIFPKGIVTKDIFPNDILPNQHMIEHLSCPNDILSNLHISFRTDILSTF